MIIFFRIYGEVKGKMRPKATAFGKHARVYTPTAQINNENWIRSEYYQAVKNKEVKTFGDKAVKIEIYVYRKVQKSLSKKKKTQALLGAILPTTKPDLDNQIKTILDALNGHAFDDDSQIVQIGARKVYSEQEYVDVYISDELNDINLPFVNIDPCDDELCL